MVNSQRNNPPDDEALKAIDQIIGRRLRHRRRSMRLSQKDLASSVGVSYQQVQKYERGINRISASRLVFIAEILSVEIGYFTADTRDGITEPSLNPDVQRALDGLMGALSRSGV